MARVLVMSASVGAGHTRAGQAVELALKALAPGIGTRHEDMMALSTAVFNRLYNKGYFDLVKVAPHMAGMLYDLSDRPRSKAGPGILKRLVQRANFKRFYDLVAEPWDLVICTHFLPAELLAHLRKRRRFRAPVVTVVTDFDAHALWANEPCERYYVGASEALLSLVHWGVPREKVVVTGIPVHPVFREAKTREACRAKHGIAPDRPCVLLLSGGYGVGPVEKAAQAVLDVETPLTLVAICGKNQALRERIGSLKAPPRHKLQAVGFTTEIDEFMRASDLVISKPGGLTTSEILATGAAMAIVNPIPGQESRNSDMLLEAGAAIKINSMAGATEKISRLLTDPARLRRLRDAARALGKPNAAFDVVRDAMTMAGIPLKGDRRNLPRRPPTGARPGASEGPLG